MQQMAWLLHPTRRLFVERAIFPVRLAHNWCKAIVLRHGRPGLRAPDGLAAGPHRPLVCLAHHLPGEGCGSITKPACSIVDPGAMGDGVSSCLSSGTTVRNDPSAAAAPLALSKVRQNHRSSDDCPSRHITWQDTAWAFQDRSFEDDSFQKARDGHCSRACMLTAWR